MQISDILVNDSIAARTDMSVIALLRCGRYRLRCTVYSCYGLSLLAIKTTAIEKTNREKIKQALERVQR